jgi:Ankyrin repeats (3 copies)/GAF domain
MPVLSSPSPSSFPNDANAKPGFSTAGSQQQQHQVAADTKRVRSVGATVAPDCTTTTTASSPLDALTERLREKLNVSWTCVSLVDPAAGTSTTVGVPVDQQKWTIESFADRKGMPLFSIDVNVLPRSRVIPVEAEAEECKIMQVQDTWNDERFRENPYVQKSAQRSYSVRFFSSTPIQCHDGKRIGSLCVCHHEPKRLTLDENALIMEHAVQIGNMLSTSSERLSSGQQGGHGGIKRARKRSSSDSEIGRRSDNGNSGSTSPTLKRRCASCGPTPFVSIGQRTEETDGHANYANSATTIIENPSAIKMPLPDPKTSSADPDEYLAQLAKALSPNQTFKLQIKASHLMEDYFPPISEEQMARYNVNVVSMARNNDLDGIKALFAEHGRDALDCYNRFGEGLLTLACRRGFRDMVQFFMSEEVNLPVRVRDDYGRTPVHDACWNPAPLLEICEWIMEKDPSLFLLADKRGFTAFQYARQSDWQVWRQFLFDHADLLRPLVTQSDLAKRFTP